MRSVAIYHTKGVVFCHKMRSPECSLRSSIRHAVGRPRGGADGTVSGHSTHPILVPILRAMTSTRPLDGPSAKRLRLRFASSTCVLCGSDLPKGSWAVLDQASAKAHTNQQRSVGRELGLPSQGTLARPQPELARNRQVY